MTIHHLILLCDFLAGILIGGTIIMLLLKIAYNNRIFDLPGTRKVHELPIPRLGGMSFLPAMIIIVASTIVVLYSRNLTSVSFGENAHFVQMTYMLVSAVILYLIGVTDDLSNLDYRVKLVFQFIASAVLVFAGLRIGNFYGMFGLHEIPAWFGIPFTILLLMFVTNAINMIDGIDGLASGLCLISLGLIFVMYFVERKFVYAMVDAAVMGALLAFWLFNMFGKREKRTKIFMGDTGSLTLGLFLSYLVVNLGVFVGHRGLTEHRNTIYFTLAFASLMIPLLDVIRLFFFRIRNHRSPFLPDMNHVHHKLLRCGFSARKTLWIILGADLFVIALDAALSLIPLDVNLIFVLDVLLYTVWIWQINRHMKPLPEA